MSFDDMKNALATLSPEQRFELQETLQAMEEGVSVEEMRAINASLDEELNEPSPGMTLDEARQSLRSLKPNDVA